MVRKIKNLMLGGNFNIKSEDKVYKYTNPFKIIVIIFILIFNNKNLL